MLLKQKLKLETKADAKIMGAIVGATPATGEAHNRRMG
jgi:hypothetical protein